MIVSPSILGIGIVGASAAGGIAGLTLAWYLRRYEGRSGVRWFIFTLLLQALWCFSYAIGLVVVDPTVREVLEMVAFVIATSLGLPFLAFALQYTGRSHIVRSNLYRGLALLQGIVVVGAITNPWHGLVWQDFTIVPTAGTSTVSLAFQPLGAMGVIIGILSVGVSVVLLVDTVVSYGPLYRREATAVALSTIPPAAALLLWIFGVGPAPNLNLAPAMFVVHAALDAYAFAGRDMFETSPRTRRAAERSSTDELETPVLIIDQRELLVTYNPAAGDLLGIDDAVLGTTVEDLLGISAAELQEKAEVQLDPSPERVHLPTVSTLTDPADTVVGQTIVLQDITGRKRREQRLEVLNRVLRHNLRNELTVIDGYTERIQNDVDDPDLTEWATSVRTSARSLLDITETVRDFEQAGSGDPSFQTVDLPAMLERITSDLISSHPSATIDFSVDTQVRAVWTDPDLLALVIENLTENGIRHDPSEKPRVDISAFADGETLKIRVSDQGPGIPDAELAPVKAGTEDALTHGSGIGLWVISWSVSALGGSVEFSTDDGTSATVSLPGAVRNQIDR